MGPKKKEGKAAAGEAVEGEDPALLLSNYQKFCKSIGLPINAIVAKNLNDEERYPIQQLLIDDEFGAIGPGGCRALMTAVMGSGPGMKGGPYKLLNSIRMWRSNCSDDGVSAIAEVLRLGGADVKIAFLELFECNIGPKGATSLGMSLSYGNNLSLLTLKLDYNGSLGDEGIVNLCRGLRTNQSLKQLHLQFCNITSAAGPHLAEVLANAKSELEVFNVGGNRLGGAGLTALCEGLAQNTKCETLCLADNMIDQMEDDLAGLSAFKDCLLKDTVALTNVDLMYNRIGEAGANILLEAINPSNTKIKEFLVDLTLPMPIFEQLFRKGGGKKGKGKGKKGKKK
mmetsp:Transcript_11018/g.18485  ORF Transcript_11018/g.18485 Transcript_11018/m.18485 type:complete len:341 (+) Transcript_11018:53-1075(+)